jgi:transposase
MDFGRPIQPGSILHTLYYLADEELDLSAFHACFNIREVAASARDPTARIRIILLAYSRGIVSRRKIEAACHDNVLSIAFFGDSQTNFTTLIIGVGRVINQADSFIRTPGPIPYLLPTAVPFRRST